MTRHSASLLLAAALLATCPARAEPPAASAAAKTLPAALPPADAHDQRIAERLRTIFSLVEELEKAEVSVRLGVVHLTGTALSEADKKRAGELARGLEGVAYVDNDLEVEAAVGERIAPERMKQKLASFAQKLPIVGVSILVFLPFLLVARIASRWKAPFRLLIAKPLVVGIVQRVLATVIVVVGAIVALQVLDVAALVGAILGTAGVVGISLGFAFRDIAENYLASVLLGIRRPFGVNDHVVIEGHEGKVVRLTMRETILMSLDGNHLRLPNAMVFKSVIVNFTRNPLRRFDLAVGVGVEENLCDAQRIGVAALEKMSEVLAEPPPYALIEALAESSVTVRFFGWIDQRRHDIFKVGSEALRRVKEALDAAGVDLPEPIQRLRIERRHPVPKAQPREEAAISTQADDSLERQIKSDLAAGDENLLS